MPGRQPWKVDCMGDSPASDMAVVMVCPFGHEDGKDGAADDPSVGYASAKEAPKLCSRGLAW
jgi:hypothetical protein